MNWIEYAIAQYVGRLWSDSRQRDLEPAEYWMIDTLTPTLIRLEQEEENRRTAPIREPRVRHRYTGT